MPRCDFKSIKALILALYLVFTPLTFTLYPLPLPLPLHLPLAILVTLHPLLFTHCPHLPPLPFTLHTYPYPEPVPSPFTLYPLPIIHYPLSIALTFHYPLPVALYPLPLPIHLFFYTGSQRALYFVSAYRCYL